MHADKVVAHAETYMGLVEFGVGVIPAGGGTKEFALRLSDEFRSGDIRLNQFLKQVFNCWASKGINICLRSISSRLPQKGK